MEKQQSFFVCIFSLHLRDIFHMFRLGMNYGGGKEINQLTVNDDEVCLSGPDMVSHVVGMGCLVNTLR
jgi:hypothetical protein